MAHKRYIGIDISDYSIEVALHSGSEVVSVGRGVLSVGVIKNGVVADAPAVKHALLEAMRTAQPVTIQVDSDAEVVMTLPKSQVYVADIEASVENEEVDIAEQVSKKIADVVPVDASALAVRYTEVGTSKQKYIRAAAIQKKVLDDYIALFKEADIGLRYITTEVEALHKSLGKSGECLLIVDLGAHETHIHAYGALGEVVFSVVSSIGGNKIKKALQDKLQIGEDESNTLLTSVGLDYDQGDDKTSFVFFDEFAPLVADLKRSLEVFTEKRGSSVDSIVLIGGVSHVPKLDEYLSYHLKQDVVHGEQRLNSGEVVGQYGYIYATAIGAAQLAMDDSVGMDFLHAHTSIAHAQQPSSGLRTYVIVGVIVLSVVVMLVVLFVI